MAPKHSIVVCFCGSCTFDPSDELAEDVFAGCHHVLRAARASWPAEYLPTIGFGV